MTTQQAEPAIERAGKYAEQVRIVLLHDHYDANHLADVIAEMETMGAPVLRATWSEGYGCWFALEGCHRLRAAQALGLMPLIVEVDAESEVSDDAGYDLQDGSTAGALIDRNSHNVEIVFDRY